ncbi:MAG TPA: hypothetical protein VFK02_17875 [Kofleriaceae bacterium]|nr:hypothetical protein [Kofleriaceae bacterium]
MAIRLGLPRTCAYWLAFRAALVGLLGRLLGGGSPAEHGAAGRQSLRLLRLGHGLLLFLERSPDAGNVVSVERGHVVVHFEAERSDLGDEVLVGDAHLFGNLIDAHLRSGRPSP